MNILNCCHMEAFAEKSDEIDEEYFYICSKCGQECGLADPENLRKERGLKNVRSAQ